MGKGEVRLVQAYTESLRQSMEVGKNTQRLGTLSRQPNRARD